MAKDKNEKIKEFWENRKTSHNYVWKDHLDQNIRIIKEYLSLETDVLDLGCGDCKLANNISLLCHEIVAVDYVDVPKELSTNVDFILSDITKFSTGRGFDVVSLFSVSYYLSDDALKTLYKNCYKALNSGGTILVISHCAYGKRKEIEGFSENLNSEYFATYRSISEDIQLLEEAGFYVSVTKAYKELNIWRDTDFFLFEGVK